MIQNKLAILCLGLTACCLYVQGAVGMERRTKRSSTEHNYVQKTGPHKKPKVVTVQHDEEPEQPSEPRVDPVGPDALSEAVRQNNRDMVKALIETGAPINAADGTTGLSPLHVAILGQNADMVELLLTKKAYVNIRDGYGGTPLHIATGLGNVELVELLLSAGANPNVMNKEGRVPLDLLLGLKGLKKNTLYKAIFEAFIKAGADLRKASQFLIARPNSVLSNILITLGLRNEKWLRTLRSRCPSKIPLFDLYFCGAAAAGLSTCVDQLILKVDKLEMFVNALRSAVLGGSMAVVESLYRIVGAGLDIASLSRLLALAVEREHLAVVEFLLDRNVEEDRTPFDNTHDLVDLIGARLADPSLTMGENSIELLRLFKIYIEKKQEKSQQASSSQARLEEEEPEGIYAAGSQGNKDHWIVALLMRHSSEEAKIKLIEKMLRQDSITPLEIYRALGIQEARVILDQILTRAVASDTPNVSLIKLIKTILEANYEADFTAFDDIISMSDTIEERLSLHYADRLYIDQCVISVSNLLADYFHRWADRLQRVNAALSNPPSLSESSHLGLRGSLGTDGSQ